MTISTIEITTLINGVPTGDWPVTHGDEELTLTVPQLDDAGD